MHSGNIKLHLPLLMSGFKKKKKPKKHFFHLSVHTLAITVTYISTPSRMTGSSPFFGLQFRWWIPWNQEEGPHRVHVTQGYINKHGYSLIAQSQTTDCRFNLKYEHCHMKAATVSSIIDIPVSSNMVTVAVIQYFLVPQAYCCTVRTRHVSHCVLA